jgi:hypothetical protein
MRSKLNLEKIGEWEGKNVYHVLPTTPDPEQVALEQEQAKKTSDALKSMLEKTQKLLGLLDKKPK